ncbi:hypothetical protein E0E52_02545 [Azotobacter chroococcum]|uniref:A24 family peptidase n=1 Tax=Azotobacter chroococcum TaxID=353 RepID=UPI00103DC539|nr:prepilin peptidase [Azotobacter chroococcum]TBW10705.1 hypothetical protein E0E52_02545 [Azotobacter chroococcum]
MLLVSLSVFLVGAVVFDFISCRLPNYYLMLGLLISLAYQLSYFGLYGVAIAGGGVLTGFGLLVPLYAVKGMAAGDVKLMAVVGSFLGAAGALWAGACSLIAGAVLGVCYLLYKKQFGRLLSRYWAMASLRTHIPAQEDDAARHRFPYAIAIFTGTLISLFWQPFGL